MNNVFLLKQKTFDFLLDFKAVSQSIDLGTTEKSKHWSCKNGSRKKVHKHKFKRGILFYNPTNKTHIDTKQNGGKKKLNI